MLKRNKNTNSKHSPNIIRDEYTFYLYYADMNDKIAKRKKMKLATTILMIDTNRSQNLMDFDFFEEDNDNPIAWISIKFNYGENIDIDNLMNIVSELCQDDDVYLNRQYLISESFSSESLKLELKRIMSEWYTKYWDVKKFRQRERNLNGI
jgi:hypothetical protein